jgi:cleavage and polyadenylation specificity factor subunit 2
MITFTPLSGAARSNSASPLSYLLQVDDVRILLDCGSPDWTPENVSSLTSESEDGEIKYPWTEYCESLRRLVPQSVVSGWELD